MGAPCHVCLIGRPLWRDWELVERLVQKHEVTLLHAIAPRDLHLVAHLEIAAADSRACDADPRGCVELLRRSTGAAIVLLDGGLGQREVATVLHAGAQDYFSEPFDFALIAERLTYLAESRSAARARARKDADGRV